MKSARFLGVILLFSFGVITSQSQNAVKDSTDMFAHVLESLNTFKLVKQSGNNFPVQNLVEDKIGFLVPDNADEWQNSIYRYAQFPVYVANDTSYVETLAQDSISHLIIVGSVDSIKLAINRVGKHIQQTSAIVFSDTLTNRFTIREMVDNLLYCSTNSSLNRDLAIQVAFNALPLPVDSINSANLFNKELRLRFLPAKAVQINAQVVKSRVDSIVNEAIEAGAFPGCRVLVAIKGAVIFNESYGYHTYKKRIRVQEHDVYDLASVTKISGPLPLIIKACDKGLMDLDEPFYLYWPDWKQRLFHRSNKEEMTLREVLAHQARLSPYINYYPELMEDGRYRNRFFDINSSKKFSLRIDEHLYLSTAFKKRVYKAIRQSPLLDDAKYKYSGLSYMLYPELLENIFDEDYESLLYSQIYSRLGASSLCYKPIGKIDDSRLVPTEYDRHFRQQQLKGLVHDEAAAVMGGVSGNAGLFASAGDLAKLMQLYLQKGTYGGERYFSEETVEEFTKVQFPENENRRGAGFDKPLFGNDTLSIKESYPAPGVSASSYGHSGFTGTFVWIDPEYEMVYIFLSNRVYPTRDNPLIYQMNVRPAIQQVFYDALQNVN